MLSKRGVLVTQSERRLNFRKGCFFDNNKKAKSDEKQGEGGRQNTLLQSFGGFLTILADSSFPRFTLETRFETISAFTEVSSRE